MPRTKKAAQRGNHQSGRGVGGGSRSGRRADRIQTSFVPFDGTGSPRRGHTGFTLQEEARNTERHHSFWDTDQRLRDSKVKFVSAGTLESTEPKDTEAALAKMTRDSDNVEEALANIHLSEPSTADQTSIHDSTYPENKRTSIDSPTDNQTISDFVIDTRGGEPVHTGIPPPRLRSISPTPSDSSEEVILFRGRDQQGRGLSSAHQAVTPTDRIDAKIRIVEDRIHEKEALLQEVLRRNEPLTVLHVSAETSSAEMESQRRKHRGRFYRQSRGSDVKQIEDDALMADYIANMDSQDGGGFESFNQRELGDSEDDVWKEAEDSLGDANPKAKLSHQTEWDRSDICDFDDLSTSDGVKGDVLAILSKRDRSTGVQYLVIWEDQTADEARWVPASTLTSLCALSHIEKFEAEEKLLTELKNNGDDDTSDSDEPNIDDSADEDEDDEVDLVRRKIERMSDEQMARLLAKQEELGMGSTELLLFDGEADIDEAEDSEFPRTSFGPIMLPSKKQPPRGAGSKRARGDFPPARLLADAYDGFDVMDFDRPSLKKKPKGRRGKLAFDLSDSELEASMQMAWDNDRIKKKERKQEREELRAQGLLGSKTGKVDLKQKYKEGMGIHAVKEEIKAFLMGSDTMLSLPPMDKADRKVVHELANAFNLKSKSAGNGNKRFPILHRTQRTSIYVERNFNAVEERLSHRFLPRMDISGKRSSGGTKRGGGGGFINAAVSYRDGDIVGGSAPELGAENRGRAMLEKMGWSSGTALGALNNKGILQPVAHVVKTTKAGLG